jgi:hypothetical protein
MKTLFFYTAILFCSGWSNLAIANKPTGPLTKAEQDSFVLPSTVQNACNAADITSADCIAHAWACNDAGDRAACGLASINNWILNCTTDGKDDGRCSIDCVEEKICPAKTEDTGEVLFAEEQPAEPAPIIEPQPPIVPTVTEENERIVCPGDSCNNGPYAGIAVRSPGPEPFRVHQPQRRYSTGLNVIIKSTIPKW